MKRVILFCAVVYIILGCQSNTQQHRTAPVLPANATTSEPLVLVQPKYPIQAAREKRAGWVHLNYDIDATGVVTNLKIVDASPTGYGFETEAAKAVQQWRYKPIKVSNNEVVLTFKIAP